MTPTAWTPTPPQSGSYEMWPIVGIYDNLVRWDPEIGGGDGRRIIGDLAEKWNVSPGGLTYTFHLHRNVVWDDGTPFSSADALGSLNRILGVTDPDFSSPRGGVLLRPIVDSVSAPDDNTIVVKLKFPTRVFLPSIGSDWVKILRKDIVSTAEPQLTEAGNIHGTGPFKWGRFTRGLQITWEKSPTYRNPDLPYIDGVRSLFIAEIGTVLAAFATRRILMWPPQSFPAPEHIEQVKAQIGEDNLESPMQFAVAAPGVAYVNSTKPPFDNPDAVRAAWLGLDRLEIQRKGMKFDPRPGEVAGGPIPRAWIADMALPEDELRRLPGLRRTADGRKHPDDIAEAKRLWASIGAPVVETECVGFAQAYIMDPLQIISNQMEQLFGIKCPTVAKSVPTYLEGGNTRRFIISYIVTATTIPDADGYIAINWTKDGARNWGGYFDPEIEFLRNQELKETDPVRQKEQIQKIQRIAMDHTRPIPNPNIPVAQMVWNYPIWNCVKNWHSGPDIFDDRRYDRVWLDEGCR